MLEPPEMPHAEQQVRAAAACRVAGPRRRPHLAACRTWRREPNRRRARTRLRVLRRLLRAAQLISPAAQLEEEEWEREEDKIETEGLEERSR